MNNIINSYIIFIKQEYKYNKNIKSINFEKFYNNSELFLLNKKFFSIEYTQYNNNLFYILPSVKNIRTYNIVDTNETSKETIIKTKRITWPFGVFFNILLVYLSFDKYKDSNSLLASANYGLAEIFIINKYSNFDHLYIEKSNNPKLYIIANKLKITYIFNDFLYGIRLKKKYKLMVFDLIIDRIIGKDLNNELEFTEILEKKERSNLFLLEKLYVYLDNLEEDGELLLLLGLYFMEETLLLLESIFNCFESVKIYKTTYNVANFPYAHCRKFKKKVHKQEKLSENFYNFIKNMYIQSISSFNLHMFYNNYINNLLINKPYSDELKQIENKCLYISNEIAKFIGFETYLIQDNLDLTLSNNLQNLFLMNQPVNIIIENESSSNDYKIILNKNNIFEELKIIYKKYKKLNKQLELRPQTILQNIINEIVNYKQSIINIVNIKNTNKKDQITDTWIQIFELMHIINFKELNKNSTINLLHLCLNNDSIQAILFYVNKFMPDTKLNWNKLDNSDCESCNINDIKDSIYKNMNFIICNNIIDDIKIKCFNILYILYNLKQNGNCILNFVIPLKDKIIIDLLYLFYLSFEKIFVVKPIQNKFDTNFYIIGVNYKKIITNFDDILNIFDNEKINSVSIIAEYSNEFKYQFIKTINILTSIAIDNIDMQLFYTDFWNRLDDNIKSEIKNTIDIKNKNYIKKYFNFI